MDTPDERHSRFDDTVRFSTKELFIEIRRDIGTLSQRIDVEVRQIANRLNDIELRGTTQAQEALREVKRLDDRLYVLDKTVATTEAVTRNEKMISRLWISFAIVFVGWLIEIALQIRWATH